MFHRSRTPLSEVSYMYQPSAYGLGYQSRPLRNPPPLVLFSLSILHQMKRASSGIPISVIRSGTWTPIAAATSKQSIAAAVSRVL